MQSLLSKPQLLIILAVALLTASFLFNSRLDRPAVGQLEARLDISSDHSLPENLVSYQATTSADTVTLTTSSSPHPLLRFFFQCQSDCGRFWLEYSDRQGNVRQITITHPWFQQVHWLHLEEGEYSLYQPEAKFTTIATFINNPPSSIITSEPYTTNHILAPFAQTTNIFESTNPKADFVYTNYKKPRIFPFDWYEFARYLDIDATQATISATLHHPDWRENPINISQPQLQ